MKWLLERYMDERNIDTFSELSRKSGLKRRTLYDRIQDPSTLRAYEIKALDDVLHFKDEDFARLVRGQV